MRADSRTVFVDTDNAMGSAAGDVDDAYAIAALVLSGARIAAIAAVEGNTVEPLAHENNLRLAELLGYRGALLRAGDARAALPEFPGRVVALGPLTSVAAARRAAEIIVVGGNSSSSGRWPPLWPHEFNLTFDRDATLAVFHSDVPLTIFPLDVARELWVTWQDLDAIGGTIGDYLRRGSERWFSYLRWRRLTTRFAIYDLAAALYAVDESGFVLEETMALMWPNTFLEFGRGRRKVKVCRSLERERVWRRFLELLNQAPAARPVGQRQESAPQIS